MDDVEVATIRKNAREQFRIQLREFKGKRMIDLRVYAENGQGEAVPTGKGVAIKPETLDEIIAGLTDARREAVAVGMIEPEKHP